jgi:hypothetical protein
MSPIPLGILAASGGVSAAYELIQTQVLSSTASSVTFASIPQTYKHLQLRASVRTTRLWTEDELKMTFNGVTTNSYSFKYTFGTGSSATSSGSLNQPNVFLGQVPAANTSPSDNFAPVVLDVLDYSSTVKNTTGRSFASIAASIYRIWLGSQLFMNTAAINSIELFPSGGQLQTGSRFSLYGIKG